MSSNGSPVCHCCPFPRCYLQTLGIPHGRDMDGTELGNLFAASVGLGHLYCAGSELQGKQLSCEKKLQESFGSSCVLVGPAFKVNPLPVVLD